MLYTQIKNLTLTFLLTCIFSMQGWTQKTDTIKGYVSFLSSKNIYVKFESTKSIKTGDTLFIKGEQGLVAALIVITKSSTSCVCNPITESKFPIQTEIYFKHDQVVIQETPKEKPVKEIMEVKQETEEKQTFEFNTSAIKKPASEWKGRLSIASYSNISSNNHQPSHRLNYTLSLNGNQIGKSKFSFETYISFRHKIDEWYKVKENINNALKIYSLAIKYSFANDMDVYLGRKINYNLSSMGAIDGIQLEKRFDRLVIGAVAGSRPDLGDYSLNMKLVQMGGYVGYKLDIGNKFNSQNTLALVEQLNHGNTDRRFLHFQHTSTIFNNLSIFSSLEFDLFEKLNEVKANTFRLTNLYLTMRYRVSRKLSISASYDARSDIIYYETYKNRIDSLLEYETRQGLRLQFNYQPFRFVSLGCSGNLRFQKDNQNDSKNVNAYLTYSKVPWIGCSINLTGNYLLTDYMESKSYGINLSRDVFKSRIYADVYYRKVDYQYTSFESAFGEQIVGMNLLLLLNKKISFNVYGEESFEQSSRYLRINLRAMLRF